MILIGCVSGCGWWNAAEEAELEDDLPEITGPADASALIAAASKPQKLELKLNRGDRFPLLKTVTQTLSQESPAGPITSHSELKLRLVIEVQEIQNGRKRLGVRYDGVRYSHDLAGRKVQYDSDTPPDPIPLEVQAYHGLVNNGFAFWIGPDNQLLELVGFDAFLQRCVRDVPPDLRHTVLAALAAGSGDEGIANFVDDSIGLLPYNIDENRRGSAVRVGDTWLRERQVVQPVPMFLSTRYSLKKMSDDVAEIDLLGSIAASATFGPPSEPGQGARLSVRRGDSFGTCVIDRNTGLPLKSEVQRILEMVVQLSDGTEVEQRKQIVTTIQAFPQQQTAARTPPHGNASAAAPTGARIGSADKSAVGRGEGATENPPPRRVSAVTNERTR